MVVNANDFTAMDTAGDALARQNAGTRPKGDKSNPNLFNDLNPPPRDPNLVRPVDVVMAFEVLKCQHGCGWTTRTAPDDERNPESLARARAEAAARVADHKEACEIARAKFTAEQKRNGSGIGRDEIVEIVNETVGKALDAKLDGFFERLAKGGKGGKKKHHKQAKGRTHEAPKPVPPPTQEDRQEPVSELGQPHWPVEADAEKPGEDEPQA